jgi:hypothetical protein
MARDHQESLLPGGPERFLAALERLVGQGHGKVVSCVCGLGVVIADDVPGMSGAAGGVWAKQRKVLAPIDEQDIQ